MPLAATRCITAPLARVHTAERLGLRARERHILAVAGLCLLLGAFVTSCKKASHVLSGVASPSADGQARPFPGFTLIQKLTDRTTSLIDMDGNIVHRWISGYTLKGGTHLLENGNLLRSGLLPRGSFYRECPGRTGIVELLDWNSEVIWDYTLEDSRRALHHDIGILPSGNVLMLAVEVKNSEEQIAEGRNPSSMRTPDLWVDYVIEMNPNGDKEGSIVWEWHLWDHLVQDFDPKRKNYGVVSKSPDRIDINFIENPVPVTASTLRQMQSIGYVGGGIRNAPGLQGQLPDWSHANAIRYNPELDQILLCFRSLGEVWIIDHSTTKAEAATGRGGRSGRGGRILYRWGNPQSYQRGSPKDQRLFGQHDAQWIPAGYPGAGNLLIFNNGDGQPGEPFSSVVEIKAPLNEAGTYELEEGRPFGPINPAWEYMREPKSSFFSRFLSGVQRLPNGNTLICSGVTGEVIEVDSSGKTVWKWQYPQRSKASPAGRAAGGIGSRTPVSPFGTQAMFRAVRYGTGHPAFHGKNLKSVEPRNLGNEATNAK